MAKGKTQTSGRTFADVLYDTTRNLSFTIIGQDTGTSFNSNYPAQLEALSNNGDNVDITVETDDSWNLSLYKEMLFDVSFEKDLNDRDTGELLLQLDDGTTVSTLIYYDAGDNGTIRYRFTFDISTFNGLHQIRFNCRAHGVDTLDTSNRLTIHKIALFKDKLLWQYLKLYL